METATYPCFVSRWFADGNGYARDARITDKTLTECIAATQQGRLGRQAGALVQPLSGGLWVLGERVDDHNCPDPRAVDRRPTLLRAVVLPCRPGRRRQVWFLDQLRKLPVPARAELCPEGLSVLGPPPLELPAPQALPGAAGLVWGPAAVGGGTAAALAGWVAAASVPVGWPWLLPAVPLAVAWLVRGLAPRVPALPQLREREEALLDDEAGTFADDAVVVLPDSRGWSVGLGSGPGIVGPPAYDQVLVGPGLAVVSGDEETQADGGRSWLCRFVRCYAWRRGRLRITMAQWTPLPARSPLARRNGREEALVEGVS